MSTTLDRIRHLVAMGQVLVSRHGARELRNDLITLAEVAGTLDGAIVVEDYPDYWKGPALLVLQRDAGGQPIHVLWGLEKGTDAPAVLVTAYRPEATKWSEDFLVRRR